MNTIMPIKSEDTHFEALRFTCAYITVQFCKSLRFRGFKRFLTMIPPPPPIPTRYLTADNYSSNKSLKLLQHE